MKHCKHIQFSLVSYKRDSFLKKTDTILEHRVLKFVNQQETTILLLLAQKENGDLAEGNGIPSIGQCLEIPTDQEGV
jgi:hypothetical protein